MSLFMGALGLVALLSSFTFASSFHDSKCDTKLPLPSRVVAQFSDGVWIENIAVRSNGNLLLTSFKPDASLYEVVSPYSSSPTVIRHFTIDTVAGLLGITETSPDVFAIGGGNFSTTTGGVKGSFGLWSVDFARGSPLIPQLVAPIPEACLLNGETTVPQHKNLVLIADSILNVIWRVNVASGEVDIAGEFPKDSPPPGQITIGINGIHIHDGYLWWTNTTKTTDADTGKPETAMYRVKIDDDGSAARDAKVEKMVDLPALAMDDFIYGPGGEDIKWVATNSDNRVFAVAPSGRNVVVAGATDSLEFATATACQFGRTKQDGKMLYVSTGGGKINGTEQGGRIEAIDTTGFCF